VPTGESAAPASHGIAALQRGHGDGACRGPTVPAPVSFAPGASQAMGDADPLAHRAVPRLLPQTSEARLCDRAVSGPARAAAEEVGALPQ